MKIAFFSDLHIGVHKNSTDWYKIALKWCSWFIKTCEKQNIDAVVCCGDFFHHRETINVQTLNIGKKIIDAISKRFPLYMLVGNHDCYFSDKSDVNSVTLWENKNVYPIDKLSTIDFATKKFVFAPWGTDMNNLPDGDILIAHCELNNFKLNNGKVSDCKLEANTILDKIPLAFIGHIHHRTERTYSNKKQIIYVGNPFQQDFGDLGNSKGVYIYDTTDGNIDFIDNVESPIHLTVHASQFTEDDSACIPANCIVKIVIDKKLTDDELLKIKSFVNSNSPYQIVDTEYKDSYSNIQTENGEFDVNANVTIENVITEYVEKLSIDYKDEVLAKLLQSYQKYS